MSDNGCVAAPPSGDRLVDDGVVTMDRSRFDSCRPDRSVLTDTAVDSDAANGLDLGWYEP